MRKYLLSAVAAAALASPAAARDNSWYVGLEGGAMWLTKIQFDYEFAQFENRRPVDHKLGFDVDLIGGYDFGAFRAEAELGYKRASVDTWGLLDPDTGEGSDVDGRASALSTMINVMADFGADDGIAGYVGGGAGVARVRYRVGDENFAGGFRDRDNAFAWQIIAGLRTAISPSIDVGLKYRFFHTNRLKFDGTVGFGGAGPFTAEGRWRSHSLLASLIFNFGAPAAAPVIPAPASAPPPPPPATRPCPDGTVVLASEMCPAPPAPPPPPPPMPERG